jgi:hypothetical protein
MVKSAQTKFQERDMETYVAERTRALELAISYSDLQASADKYQQDQDAVSYQRSLLAWPGAMMVLIAIAGFVFSSNRSLIVFLIALALFVTGSTMLYFGINPRRWQHRWSKFGAVQICLDYLEEIELIFAPVMEGKAKIAKVASDGHGAELTPSSHQPITTYIGARAFDDPNTPAMLLSSTTSSGQFVVISPEATGDWFNFYIWNAPVAARLEDLFDKAVTIYPREPVKRIKARVALGTIAKFVTEHKLQGKQFRAKEFVVREFAKALKLEAAKLRQSNQITELEERQLCRISISGEEPSTDPAEIEGRKRPKPESWFLNLMSGDYSPILGPLAETVVSELGDLPTYVES